MEHKKKYHGGLFLFFATLFVLLFINTFSYASTLTPINQLTPDIFKLFIDELNENQAYVYVSSSSVNRNFSTFYDIVSDSQIETFCNTWNNTNFSNYADYLEQCVFLLYYDGSTPQLTIVFNNNTIGERHNHIQYLINDSVNAVCYSIDDNGTKIAGIRFTITFNLDGSITLSSPINYNSSGFSKRFTSLVYAYPMLNDTNFESELLYCYHLPQTIYANIPSSNGYSWKWLTGNSMLNLPESSEPSGDYNEAGLGDITNPSGDNAGNINLEPIQNSLDNIQNQISGDSQRIIDNQNENTNKLVNQMSGDTQKIINNTNDNIDKMFDMSNPDNSIDDLLNTASGEFKNPYDIDSINSAFLNSFDSSMSEDFIISWNGIEFAGLDGVSTRLIPSGEINFSKLCRENETLGQVKNIISIISISGLGVTMLIEFYNLVLATFGIGNYFYAETSDYEYDLTSIDNNTGSMTSRHYIRSRKTRKK